MINHIVNECFGWKRLLITLFHVSFLFTGSVIFAAGFNPLSDTGQTRCYDTSGTEITCSGTGQDGAYQGLQPSFTKYVNYNGTGDDVTVDNNTGLMWMTGTADVSGDGSIADDDKLIWQEAYNYCQNSTYAGLTGWRLPNRFELYSIINYSLTNELLDANYFTYESYNNPRYWTSSFITDHSDRAFVIYFNDGSSDLDYKSDDFFVRCVRGSEFPSDQFLDNGDQTITDQSTGLVWQKIPSENSRNWNNALIYCENLQLAGHNDWRLPNIRELLSIVDENEHDPSINSIFPATSASFFWSSTTAESKDRAWYVGFSRGFVDTKSKASALGVRCVRGGLSGSSGNTINLTVSKTGTGSGTVTSSPSGINCGSDCSEDYTSNTQVTLTATPNSNSVFSGWGGDCSGCSGNICQINVDSSKSCTAMFESSSVVYNNLIVSKTGTGSGTVTSSPSGINCGSDCSEDYTSNTQVTLTATPDTGSTFAGWGGDCTGSSPTISITLDSNKSCIASFHRSYGQPTVQGCSIFLDGTMLTNPVFLDGVDLNIGFVPKVAWQGGAVGTVKYVTPRGTHISSEVDGSIVLNVGREFGIGGKLQVIAVAPDGTESAPFEVPFDVAEPPLLDAEYYIFSTWHNRYETRTSWLFRILNENITDSRIPTTMPIWGGKHVGLNINTYFFMDIGLDGEGTLSLDYTKGLYASKATYAGKRVPLVEKKRGRRAYYSKKCSIGIDVMPSLTFSYNRKVHNWEYSGVIGLDMGGYCQTPPHYVVVTAGPVPIPFYARVGLGVDVNNELNVSNISLDDFSFDLDGLFTLNPYGKLMFGTGAADIAAIEAYGVGGLTVVLGYPDTPPLRDIYCSLKGGVKFQFLIFKYDMNVWDIRWPEAKGQMIALEVPSSEPQPLSRDYISKPDYARFHNEGSPIIRSKEVTGTNAEEELLQENVFPYSDPVIVSRDGNTYIFWIYDNPLRSSLNRTELVYSKWTGSSWTDPKPVADDGTADFNPSAGILPDGRVMVTWQNIKNQLADNSTLSDMFPLSEIAYGIYDPNSDSWNTGVITNNNYLDKSPKVACGEDGSALITWISNTGNSFLGTLDSLDTLRYALITGNNITQEGEIASNLRPILKASLAYDGTEGVLVWSSDEDGDLSTQNDTEIRTIQFNNDTGWQENTLLTDDNTTDLTPDVLLRNGQVFLVWLHGDDLVMTRDLDLSTMETAVTDMLGMGSMSFKALSSPNGLTLFWTDGSPKGTDIYISHWLEDKDIWGAPKQVTNDDSLEHSISGAFIDNDTMKLVYDKVTLSYDQEGISHPVKTDLYLLTYNEKTDILLNNLYPDRYDPPMGEDVEITAEVANVGDTAEENIPVYFYKGNPSDNNLIGQATITGVLSPQESREVSISWHVDSLPVTIVAVADPNHEITEDADYANNQKTLVLGSGPNVNKGDVNGDGDITIVDALFIARYLVGLDVENFDSGAADVNCDGKMNIIDALFVARHAVGLPVSSWCGP